MFESDDFDQVLSQFDFPELDSGKPDVLQSTVSNSPDFIPCTDETTAGKTNRCQVVAPPTQKPPSQLIENSKEQQPCLHKLDKSPVKTNIPHTIRSNKNETVLTTRTRSNLPTTANNEQRQKMPVLETFVSPKRLKRKLINQHFDQQSKRKFPGPAGLLTGVLEEAKDESIGQIELLSQDMDFTESNLRRDLFDSPLWKRLLNDTKDWRIQKIDSIKDIKQQALNGNLQRRKAQAVTAFIEAIDRSVTDPLIILRDQTGSIKCTLHRDAWSRFSPYIVSEYCALVLQNPTVLTTGGAFKKHYLNITLSNILAIFSSAVLEEETVMPDDYIILCKDELTVIKSESCSENIEPQDSSVSAEDIFEGLDNFFSDDLF